jgi:hypothetical protein
MHVLIPLLYLLTMVFTWQPSRATLQFTFDANVWRKQVKALMYRYVQGHAILTLLFS